MMKFDYRDTDLLRKDNCEVVFSFFLSFFLSLTEAVVVELRKVESRDFFISGGEPLSLTPCQWMG